MPASGNTGQVVPVCPRWHDRGRLRDLDRERMTAAAAEFPEI